MATTTNDYTLYNDFKQAGWFRAFNVSGGGHLCVPVPGAPPIGSSPGGLLFAGHWTNLDGTMVWQTSNMDKSITTVVKDPLGAVTSFTKPTLIEAQAEIHKRKII